MTYHNYPQQPPAVYPPPPPRRQRRVIVLVVVLAALLITVPVVAVLLSDDTTSSGAAFSTNTVLESAQAECGTGDLGDDGNTLVIDMEGEDAGSGTVSFDDSICVLTALKIPSRVSSRMDSTRALDGMQEAEWDGISASWTYHPDDGLDIILTLE